MIYRVLRYCAPAMMVLLSGCLGGLLGGKPDQLYRFGAPAPAGTSGVEAANQRMLVLKSAVFSPEISADRILTSQGRELSYVKDARWVTSAPALYEAALEASMRSRAAIVLLDHTRASAANGELTITISRFEAEYGLASKAPPLIRVEGRASLSIDRATPVFQPIFGEQRATANTAGAVAAAFDGAVAQSTTALTDWVDVTLPRGATPIPRR